jgi:hypothetical protein
MRRNPVAYYPELAEAVGGVFPALLLQQIAHWQGYSDDGWAFRSQEQLQNELAISPESQLKARNKLKELGILEEKIEGMPRRLYYRVDLDKVEALLKAGASNRCQREQAPVDGGSKQPQTAGTDLYESKDENKDENGGTVPEELSANFYVDYLVQQVDNQLPAMTQSRKARYGREFKQQTMAGASEPELLEACGRIAERWPDYQLSVEQAIRDNQKRRAQRREDHPHPQAKKEKADEIAKRDAERLREIIEKERHERRGTQTDFPGA